MTNVANIRKLIISGYDPFKNKIYRCRMNYETGDKIDCHSFIARDFPSNDRIKFINIHKSNNDIMISGYKEYDGAISYYKYDFNTGEKKLCKDIDIVPPYNNISHIYTTGTATFVRDNYNFFKCLKQDECKKDDWIHQNDIPIHKHTNFNVKN